MSDTLRVERDGHIATLTLNRPEAGNSLSRELLAALSLEVERLTSDRAVRAVIVTGAGEKVFCAGADLKERATMTPEQTLATVTSIRHTITALANLPMPVIAAVNGAALGGGTELALAADIRLAAETASLGLTETSLGIIPGGGGTQRLPRLVGPGRAKELIFTARRIPATEALEIGLIEEVVDPALLVARAHELARRIASNGPIAVRLAKAAVTKGLELPLNDALLLETELYEQTIDTKDRLEGLSAFREKRDPVYRGE